MMPPLNLGCGKFPIEGHYNIDQSPGEGVDLVLDLDAPDMHLPFAQNSVPAVYSSHMIEHLHHPLHLMQELWEVCVPDARATFVCPYGSSDDADENPTHVRRMFVGSWGFFGQPYYWREDYGYTADWVVEEVHLRVDDEMWKRASEKSEPLIWLWKRIRSRRNKVREMSAVLRCQKPARARDRELQESREVVFEVLEPVSPWQNRVVEVGRLRLGLPTESVGPHPTRDPVPPGASG